MKIERYEIQECLEQAVMSDGTKILFSSEWFFAASNCPGLLYQIFYVPGGFTHLCYGNTLHISVSYRFMSDDDVEITAYYDDFYRPIIQMYRGHVLYYLRRLRSLDGDYAGYLTHAYEFTLFESLFKLIQDKLKVKGHMISHHADLMMVNEMIDKEERNENRNI